MPLVRTSFFRSCNIGKTPALCNYKEIKSTMFLFLCVRKMIGSCHLELHTLVFGSFIWLLVWQISRLKMVFYIDEKLVWEF